MKGETAYQSVVQGHVDGLHNGTLHQPPPFRCWFPSFSSTPFRANQRQVPHPHPPCFLFFTPTPVHATDLVGTLAHDGRRAALPQGKEALFPHDGGRRMNRVPVLGARQGGGVERAYMRANTAMKPAPRQTAGYKNTQITLSLVLSMPCCAWRRILTTSNGVTIRIASVTPAPRPARKFCAGDVRPANQVKRCRSGV